MVTQMISEIIKEAKVDAMLQNKYSVITVKVMDIWLKSARTQGYLKVGDNRPQHHLSKDSIPMPRILYQCNILSQFYKQ